ncbi:MAG TPA: hypothetical protein VFC51_10830 [Chloroflexota bacterium]|nr:hypothetical protein [Chloroflexota bacterium]
MTDTTIYFWTDRIGRAYVTLRQRAGHWQIAWGHRDPPGGDNYMEQGKHETSVQDEAVRRTLDHIRALSEEPGEESRVAAALQEAMRSAA